jgi:nitrogen fixation NifU-like protein
VARARHPEVQRRQPFAEPRFAGRERKAAGDVSEFEQLYREVILDHYKSPRSHGLLEPHDAFAEGQNPLCGDEIAMSLTLDGDTIANVGFEGRGCAISQAATSMLTEMLRGRNVHEVAVMPKEELLEEIGIPLTPVRLKCAILGLGVLKVALHKAKGTPLPDEWALGDDLTIS